MTRAEPSQGAAFSRVASHADGDQQGLSNRQIHMIVMSGATSTVPIGRLPVRARARPQAQAQRAEGNALRGRVRHSRRLAAAETQRASGRKPLCRAHAAQRREGLAHSAPAP